MKGKLSSRRRKEIKAEMAVVLAKRMESLSVGYQEILIDDMVTAFENRLSVLNRANYLQINVETPQMIELKNI